MGRINILGVYIDNIDFNETIGKIKRFLKEDKVRIVYTPNTEIVMHSRKNKDFEKIINSADLLIPDGIGLVLASRLFGERLKERVTGYDVFLSLLEYCKREKHSIYLLGGKPEVIKRAVKNIMHGYRGINIAGYFHGYFSADEEKTVIDDINRSEPDIIFVGMGFPKQEEWIYKNKDKINSKVCMVVGGSFDILGGIKKRAPEIFCKLNLEWFYRLITEPWRFKRMLALPAFVVTVFVYWFVQKIK